MICDGIAIAVILKYDHHVFSYCQFAFTHNYTAPTPIPTPTPTLQQTTVRGHIWLPYPTIHFADRIVIWILIPNKVVVYRFSDKSLAKVHFADVFHQFGITTNLR